ncbi:MAG: NAD+ synthase [Sphingobacterium sp.]|uniref:NAD+ synthase n=1 Tax=Sphingobacterium sp. JB170 TaxID=1434842 RepID=UPI00097EAFA5|nr:NAD+ synthase [Sphingobacterium sp. JB170]SJN34096.1 NAD synthetase / Glutamine amidotransferase chain of NAD synthetase [Sphingobacterium sp. JB170]
MKIALAQLNYHIGNFEQNTTKIVSAIQKAKQHGADLVVFAELAIGGYPAKDLLRNRRFLDLCDESLQKVAAACQGISCIIGAPLPNNDPEGKALYNGAVYIDDGQIKSNSKKSLLPDYDVFDEYRYFEPSRQVSCIDIKGEKVALTICEDLWDDDASNSYIGDLMDELRKEDPTLIINIAASPFSYVHFENRINVLKRNVIKAGCPLVYVNQIGAHADIIFDGRSVVLDRTGHQSAQLAGFKEDFRIIDSNQLASPNTLSVESDSEIALIHHALVLGIRDYFQKSGFKKAVLGLSGGLDSAIVAALASEALGAENVLAVLMPSVYSTDHSLKDALDLVENTGCEHLIIPIKDIAGSFEATLTDAFAGRAADLTEENIQARIRGTLLMALSNKYGNILLNTSNKSEAAVGYGTLYGDMAGSLSVIGDVYKTQAYSLAKYINRDKVIIPENTIVKPPSAELRPDQKDSDSLPPYEILDAILYQLIELEKPASEVVHAGFDEPTVRRIGNLLNNAEFKRHQCPPILRVSSKAFGNGRVMPLVAKYPF